MLRLERQLPRDELVQHDADRIDVAAVVDRLARRLLGRGVGRRAHERPLDRRRAGADVAAQRLDQPEVEQLHEVTVAAALDEEDVLGLEIAVHEAGPCTAARPAQTAP